MRYLTICFLFFSFSSYGQIHSPARTTLSDKYDNDYPKHRFDLVIKIVQQVFSPIVAKEGGTLTLYTDWSDGAVNMWAGRAGTKFWLEIPGGMARYYLISEEAFLLSICHELGHLLGGEPKNLNISFEGQADYYATSRCTELLLSQIRPFKKIATSPEVKKTCSGNLNRERCHRTLEAAKSLTSVYAEIEDSEFPQISTPSKTIVKKTYSHHPPAQCRLDTFVNGYFKLQRPKCWFAPEESGR